MIFQLHWVHVLPSLMVTYNDKGVVYIASEGTLWAVTGCRGACILLPLISPLDTKSRLPFLQISKEIQFDLAQFSTQHSLSPSPHPEEPTRA